MNREEWLSQALTDLKEDFSKFSDATPKMRVTLGFPSSRALSTKKRRIGECWGHTASADGTCEILISPLVEQPLDILGVLVHEMAHAYAGHEAGHKGPFKKLAVSMGLEGKMTATTVGEELKERLNNLISKLGDFPGAALNAEAMAQLRKKQTTRMCKLECEECGYTLRTTKKWIEKGLPVCCCGGEFDVDEPREDDDE